MIVIGSRGSDLALWQAKHVQALLAARAGLAAEIRIIQTAGDRIQDVELAGLDGKGFFTKEIEEALLAGEIDLAVHSHKDLPTESPPGLTVAAVPERGPVEECLLVRDEAWDASGAGAAAARGGGRRHRLAAAQQPVAGPASRPADRTTCAATCRPGCARRARGGTTPSCSPAPGSCASASIPRRCACTSSPPPISCRPRPRGPWPCRSAPGGRGARRTPRWPRPWPGCTTRPTARAVAAERLLLAACEGGCNLPLGAWAVLAGDEIVLTATLGQPDGTGASLRRARRRSRDRRRAWRTAN